MKVVNMLLLLKMVQRTAVEATRKSWQQSDKAIAQPQLKEQSYVYLLCFYLSKLPQIASERDVFYWQPKESMPMSPLGTHLLIQFVRVMVTEFFSDGNFFWFCTNCHKKKNYACEAMAFLASYQFVLSPRLAHQLLWSRFINMHGKPGRNIRTMWSLHWTFESCP